MRVRQAFDRAKKRGIQVEQRSLSQCEIVDLLRSGHVLLTLVDQRRVECETCHSHSHSHAHSHNDSSMTDSADSLANDSTNMQTRSMTATHNGSHKVMNDSSSSSHHSHATSSSLTPSSVTVTPSSPSSFPASGFMGHFILVTGLPSCGSRVSFIDSSVHHKQCTISLDRFDAARLSDGTDEDVIAVNMKANKGTTPKWIDDEEWKG